MKKIYAALLIISLFTVLGACKRQTIVYETTEATSGASVIDDITGFVSESETSSQVTGTADETTTQPEESSQTQVATTESTTQEQTTQDITLPDDITDVDLSISLPEANGKMQVDRNASNKFISAVAKDRKIQTDKLAAVYSVPESGQNYVFEFNSADKFTSDNLCRVYLLDSSCKITGVASTKSNEREKITATENWFCMNVLIKGVIFPAIEDMF